MHLGGRAIDFVREDQVRKNRTVLRAERAVARVVDHGADDVRGQHVGSKLQALKIQTDRGGERLERERFREAGHAFEKDVAVADQADDEPIDEFLLADDNASHLLTKRLHPRGRRAYVVVDRLNANIWIAD